MKQLLVELGRLRQREELAAVHPARHQVVARAFRRRLGEDRRLDLEEAELIEVAPGGLHEPVAQDQVALQLGPAEVEHPVPEPQLLRRQLLLLLARDRNRRRLRRSHHLEPGDVQLDLARDQRRVARGLGPELDRAARQDDGLGAEAGGARHDLGRRPGGIAGELDQAGPVAQVDEDQAAEVPAAVHPAAEPDFAADVGPGERAGEMGAEGGRGGLSALRRRRGCDRTHLGSGRRPAAGGRSPSVPTGRCDSGS